MVTHCLEIENGRRLFIGTVPPYISSYRQYWKRKWEEVIGGYVTYIYSSYKQFGKSKWEEVIHRYSTSIYIQ